MIFLVIVISFLVGLVIGILIGWRIIAEHAPNLFAIIGFYNGDDPPLTMTVQDVDGNPVTYYRARSTSRWIVYRRAIHGSGRVAGVYPPGELG